MSDDDKRHMELARLLVSLFPGRKLNGFLVGLLHSLSGRYRLPKELRGDRVPSSSKLARFIGTLDRERHIHSYFWDLLRRERPSRVGDIDRVARLWEEEGHWKGLESLRFPAGEVFPQVARGSSDNNGAPPLSFTLSHGDPKSDPEPSSPSRLVNTGLSEAERPESPLASDQCLVTSHAYFFWLEVGAWIEGSIEDEPVSLPEDLPSGARLRVVLFSSPGGLVLQPDADQGVLCIEGDGRVVVERPACVPPALQSRELADRRLFFPLRTPQAPGTYRLRCNIHHEGLLVQSRDVVLTVAEQPQRQSEALRSRVDYALSQTLSPTHLRQLGSATLSVLLNDDDWGTHGFRFVGGDDYRSSVHLDDAMLQEMISLARGAFRRASWGSKERYEALPSRPPYRYQGAQSEARLREDLVMMARIGRQLYDRVAEQLGQGADGADALRERMRLPGHIQLALKQGARHLVPISIFYDHRLDVALKDFTLCEAFIRASVASEPLEKSPCFQGDCPHREDRDVVCPSGFWGFRHTLALPFGMAAQGERGLMDLPGVLRIRDTPALLIAVSEDPDFVLRDNHLMRLQAMSGVAPIQVARSREKALELLRQQGSHLVYFYCHGGVDAETRAPFLQVGPLTDPYIFRDTLRVYDIRWRDPAPHPLVFINGCHTTELEPEQAIELVSGFVERAGAAGVIGTEVTIFEPLAVGFASRFMDAFLRRRLSLGASVREARLGILQHDFNPLGLVYLPFALSSLHLAGEASEGTSVAGGAGALVTPPA
ncbi:CHAT domain-containing protein [Vitiosangium sp. GDMCC 1.1324]|uniref:Probable protease Ga0334635_1659 n=1 Tax=Vitiosangium sp. (strain GDMCC 1.1324) TaxID=2138576 RepID=PROT_VITXG|nr:CHAT domain-containing protein [Vitiosangium sp. GDMCC 1.1324]A0A2T4VDP8.1 RecName: Full=Probable protease Ga0334635_1659 [Vitiosangium sp. GDMCC 1.1324]PTL79886.1 hypothetical protein DAT35_31120 [Vitiosangium sp. GDMCC 1.1324]